MPPSFRGVDFEYNTYNLPTLNNEYEKYRADSIADELANCTDCEGNNPPSYYGRGMEVNIDIFNKARYQEFGDSVKQWKLLLHSETALGLQFYFEKFYLPEGAELFIYSADSSMILGAFTEQNHHPDENAEIPFGTQPLAGNRVMFEIEYTKPSPDVEWDTPDMVLTNVIHVFEDVIPKSTSYGKSLPCNVDVECALGNGWDKEIKSVALILGYNVINRLATQCSGSVLNNPDK